MNETMTPLSLRLPQDIRQQIETIAARERRSINSQIVVLLESALPKQAKSEAA